MKKVLFLIFVGTVLFRYNVSAQEYNPSAKALGLKESYETKVQTFTKMKSGGKALTFGGAVLTVIGIGVIVDVANHHSDINNSYNNDEDSRVLAGVVAVELGTAMTAGGIVLWCIGASKSNKYSQKIKNLSLNLNPDIHQKFSLVYKF